MLLFYTNPDCNPWVGEQAHEVMIGSPGAATKLMYQIFIALGRKKVCVGSCLGNVSMWKKRLAYL